MNLDNHLNLTLKELIQKGEALQGVLGTNHDLSVIITGTKAGDIYIFEKNEGFRKNNELDDTMRKTIKDAEHFRFELKDNKESYILVGFKSNVYTSHRLDIVIPSKYKNKKIIKIAPFAFYEVKIGKLVIPNTIQTISEEAFNSCGIHNLELAEGTQKIEGRAFFNNRITILNLPETLEVIGTCAFSYNYLNRISIKSSPYLYGGAFRNNGPEQKSNNIINRPYLGDWKLDSNAWKKVDFN